MMKKYIYLIVAALAWTAGCMAQQPFKRELAVGVNGGVNFSSIGFTPKVDQSMLMGITGGATLRWITEKNLGLSVELNLSQQGWKESFPDDEIKEQPVGYAYSRTLSYIEMPFLTHIYFGSQKARFIFNLGPKIGYMFQESSKADLHGEWPNFDGDENEQNNGPNRINYQHAMTVENKFDWGLCGGPGLELRTGIGSFLLEGRYYMALGNIYGSKKVDKFAKSNGQTLSVKLTYLFTLKKW
ncbi:PorT family protein [Parabacteroides sp. 52]|uniref:porin family protein n=1 Tax=unclassified Parabacteroides TaxID=2649774 RepID=UPI0013CF920C|nr:MULTISPECIES: porin family protein [unclassified Parabacteroides]MDH6535292.1 hypothetical protein [Parabacteroides sp. PM5-20]NDV55855.1 PorT family protein [Parabacteroides sp. 52]